MLGNCDFNTRGLRTSHHDVVRVTVKEVEGGQQAVESFGQVGAARVDDGLRERQPTTQLRLRGGGVRGGGLWGLGLGLWV